MTTTPPGRSGPPRHLALLARLLVRGEGGPLIREDLAESFARDLERGVPAGRASRRYTRNLLGSAVSVWKAALTGVVTRGALLDAKLGVRMLGKQPLLTGVAVLALGLGIPASLSMVHVLGVLVRPLPVPEGARVMGIRNWDRTTTDPDPSRIHDYVMWRETLVSFEEIAAVRPHLLNLRTGEPGPPPVRGADISVSAFGLLRATPLMGRVFGAADEVRDAPDVAILGEDLWTARFAADPEIVGRTVQIGGREHTVVGVMPSGFRFPNGEGVWLPLRASPVDYPPGEGPELFVVGRLAEGVSRDDADLEVARVTERRAVDDPERYGHFVGEVVDVPILLLEEDRIFLGDPELLFGQSIMFLFLLIVCGNVGTLILARTATRTAEISIRTALGASRTRIVTQLFIETVVLALVATGLGLLASEGVARWLARMLETQGSVPYWMDFGLNPGIILLALGLGVVSGAFAGVLPALKATGRGVQANLQRVSAGGGTIRFGLGSSLLVVSEVVLSVGFLAMGGVLVRSAFQRTEGRLGFAPERYLGVTLDMPWVDPADRPGYADEAGVRERRRRTQSEVQRRLAEDPDVRGVGMVIHMPGTSTAPHRIVLEAESELEEAEPHVVIRAEVDVGYFRGLDRPILAGRDFSTADVEGPPSAHRTAVIVNTSFVDQTLRGRSAVGQRFRVVTRGDTVPALYDWFEIVGVVGPFGMNGINPGRDAGVYYPFAPGERDPVRYLVEVGDQAATFVPHLREIVAAVDPEATLGRPRVVADAMRMESDFFRWAFTMEVVLAGIAFLLSVSGLYALMSFTVSQRTREIGIRTALGARAWSIVTTIARRAVIQLGVGLALGVPWAWVLLWQIDNDVTLVPVDVPLTIGVTMACAAVVGIVACASPTLRGLRIQPTQALRES